MIRALLGVAVLLLIPACSDNPQSYVEHYKYDLNGLHVHEFLLLDGTRCVVTSQGGASCDWKERVHDLIL